MLEVMSLKEQYELQDKFLMEKLEMLPMLMKECGIDMWIVPSKEYNEDPIFQLLTPSKFPTARRITILVFALVGDEVKRYCVNRRYPDLEELYENYWLDESISQWAALEELVKKYQPKTIGLNVSPDFAYCDGLSKGMYDELCENVSDEMIAKFVSAQYLGIRYLETRTKSEMEWYPKITDLALEIIAKAFSSEVIKPGVTTTADVEWWMMQTVNSLGLSFWFPPDVNLQRLGESDPQKMDVIQRGDLLHCDFGIVYLGLCTDTQRLAYVVKEGETNVPDDMMELFKENNHFQDIVRENFVTGRSGNAVFTASINKAKAEGIKPLLYSHPVGKHGHAAGPTIGLFNQQEEIPVQGDLLIHDDTVYALELNTRKPLASWNHQEVYMFTEETVLYTNHELKFLTAGRDRIYLIK